MDELAERLLNNTEDLCVMRESQIYKLLPNAVRVSIQLGDDADAPCIVCWRSRSKKLYMSPGQYHFLLQFRLQHALNEGNNRSLPAEVNRSLPAEVACSILQGKKALHVITEEKLFRLKEKGLCYINSRKITLKDGAFLHELSCYQSRSKERRLYILRGEYEKIPRYFRQRMHILVESQQRIFTFYLVRKDQLPKNTVRNCLYKNTKHGILEATYYQYTSESEPPKLYVLEDDYRQVLNVLSSKKRNIIDLRSREETANSREENPQTSLDKTALNLDNICVNAVPAPPPVAFFPRTLLENAAKRFPAVWDQWQQSRQIFIFDEALVGELFTNIDSVKAVPCDTARYSPYSVCYIVSKAVDGVALDFFAIHRGNTLSFLRIAGDLPAETLDWELPEDPKMTFASFLATVSDPDLRVVASKMLQLFLCLCSAEPNVAQQVLNAEQPQRESGTVSKFPPAAARDADVYTVVMYPGKPKGSCGTGKAQPEETTRDTTRRSHKRKAHWHRYWVGSHTDSNSRRLIMKWIPEITVNAANALPVRIVLVRQTSKISGLTNQSEDGIA